MTIGVGGSNAQVELEKIENRTLDVLPIQLDEYMQRLKKAVDLMKASSVKAMYLNAGTNLYYYTGTLWGASERMVGALLFDDGSLVYIAPQFEEGTFNKYMLVQAPLHCWQEHESPYELIGKLLSDKHIHKGLLALDESAPYFLVEGLEKAIPLYDFVSAQSITSACRMHKSTHEIAIIQRAKDITMEVQRATARILRPGITVDEVVDFVNKAHIKAGIASGSYFCIVLFGEDTQYPHGVTHPQPLQENQAVIVDTGCRLYGYLSDITRSYVYGEPNEEYRKIWNLEQQVQLAAFEAAVLGASCGSVDAAARQTLAAGGLSPDYDLPGLPHRVGHGTGLDIHENPYLVRGSSIKLAQGMVVSNEPMICIPGKFGIRHEDHFYMDEEGAQWFTKPMHSLDNPFGYF